MTCPTKIILTSGLLPEDQLTEIQAAVGSYHRQINDGVKKGEAAKQLTKRVIDATGLYPNEDTGV